jgi:hypothetical protein
VKLAVEIVLGSISRENVAETVTVTATSVALAAGFRAVTVGAGGGWGAVVKLHVTGLDSGTPSDAVTVVSTRAVYVVENASVAFGVSTALRVASS